jgi:hypothetical protein
MLHCRWNFPLFAAFCVSLALSASARAAASDEAEPLPEKIRFNRDIRPVLSENCFKCHGFDEKERKAGLRLDTKDGLTHKHKDIIPVVAGDLSKSEVYRRITAADEDDLMPPVKSGKKLTPRQKELIKRWIEQGMDWEPHWSFTPVVRPPVPAKLSNAGWVRNPVDAFILERLDKLGLKPSGEADKVTLIRRVTLDLTGLPPTPAEVDAFVADASPDAYEKLVDRLLASPHYGERMAIDWLDAGRYADTHGYHIDSGRDQTRWREWVIDAFTRNKPYDKFIVEQLAGDLLPNPTIDQRVATAFHRNHMINFEGGANPDEYHTAYLIDRVNTTGSVFLGLTVGCSTTNTTRSRRRITTAFTRFSTTSRKKGSTASAVTPPRCSARRAASSKSDSTSSPPPSSETRRSSRRRSRSSPPSRRRGKRRWRRGRPSGPCSTRPRPNPPAAQR